MKAPEVKLINTEDVDSFEEEMQRKMRRLREVLGGEVSVERIRYFLNGSNGNEEVALNHILNDLEKDSTSSLVSTLFNNC
jgi:hypothetical protein